MDQSLLDLVVAAIRVQDAEGKLLADHGGNLDATRVYDPRVPTLRKLSDYANRDQWGAGKYWRGRRPKDEKLDEVTKLFIQDDQIGPALGRFVSATLGKDPEWTLEDPAAPEGTSTNALSEPTEALTQWHRDSRLHQELKAAFRAMLWGRRAILRMYVPDVYLDQLEATPPSTLAQALEYIHIMALDVLQADVVRDAHGREVGYFYRYSQLLDRQPKMFVEVHTAQQIQVFQWIGGNLQPVAAPMPNPLYDPARFRRPRYLLHLLEWTDDPIVHQGILDKQDGLNVAWTNLRRNDDLAGFRAVISTNAEEVVDEQDRPVHWKMGPDRVVNLTGLEQQDASGGITLSTPMVTIVDPIDPNKASLPTIEALTLTLLRDFDQLWIEMVSGAVAAESRRQSRKAFDNRVMNLATPVVEALRWALQTALLFSGYYVPAVQEKWSSLEVHPKLFLDVSRGDLEVFKAILPAYQDNLISLDTLLEANPAVSDVGMELDRLTAQKTRSIKALLELAAQQNLDRVTVLTQAGFTEQEARAAVEKRLEEEAKLGAGIGG